MRKFFQTTKLIISIFGIVSATFGIWGAWLEIEGSYEKMGAAFFAWILLQMPVNILSLLVLPIFSGHILIYYFLTFLWWFLLGVFLGFIIISLKHYFESINIE